MLNQRCQNIINLKKFQLEALNQVYKWNVSGLNSKLTLVYSSTENEDLLIVLCREALAQLLNGRSTNRLASLTYKEFESFLRDDNITPAFTVDMNLEMADLFEKERFNLMYEVFLFYFRPKIENLNSNFIGKIRMAIQILQDYRVLFGSSLDIKLCHFEHEFLYYDGKNVILIEETKLLIEKIFKFVFNQDIKLVAV